MSSCTDASRRCTRAFRATQFYTDAHCSIAVRHTLQLRHRSPSSCALTCRLTRLFTSSGHLGLTSKHAAPSPSSTVLPLSFHLISLPHPGDSIHPPTSTPAALIDSIRSATVPLIPSEPGFDNRFQILANPSLLSPLPLNKHCVNEITKNSNQDKYIHFNGSATKNLQYKCPL